MADDGVDARMAIVMSPAGGHGRDGDQGRRDGRRVRIRGHPALIARLTQYGSTMLRRSSSACQRPSFIAWRRGGTRPTRGARRQEAPVDELTSPTLAVYGPPLRSIRLIRRRDPGNAGPAAPQRRLERGCATGAGRASVPWKGRPWPSRRRSADREPGTPVLPFGRRQHQEVPHDQHRRRAALPLHLRIGHRGPSRQDVRPDLGRHPRRHPREDPEARVACETATTTGLVAGPRRDQHLDLRRLPAVVRDTVRDIGYTRAEYGFDYLTCGTLVSVKEQSS